MESMSPGLLRVRRAAERGKSTRFTSLIHHITPDLLTASYRALKHEAAPGVDGCVWAEYGQKLEENLKSLHTRMYTGSYRARPSRRVYIPKSDGTKRPLGIASVEDKVLQHAVSETLSAIYEADFYGFSYGFRPGRGCHNALDALYVAIMKKQVNYVLDADIQGFFDSISHTWMRRFLECRIADQRILRLIDKWLKAGISEDGEWSRSEVGTPQGAVISPLLANIFLHYVLDDWVVWWRKKHANGDVVIVRYADDFVMGFQYKQEAESFLIALRNRLEQFSLRLHPNKTRLIEFGKYASAKRRSRGEGKPETFTFLGFTHICSVNWKHKCFKILRQTDKKRMRETLARIGQNLKTHMHHDIDAVGYWLKRMIQGYYQYFAVPDNTRRLYLFRASVLYTWYKVLLRRSQRRSLTWKKFRTLVEHWIPKPTPLHPYPEKRFCANYA